MKLTRGGKAINEFQFKDIPLDRIEPLTHDLWESMVDLQQYRAAVAPLWERVIGIEAKIAKRPGDPRMMKAEVRIDLLKYHIRELQWKFLMLEEDADLRWRQMPPHQREEQGLPEMFAVSSDAEHLYGLWSRKIGSQKPTIFPIDPILFKFVTVPHANAYEGRTSWRNPDTEHDPESVSKKTRMARSRGSTSPSA